MLAIPGDRAAPNFAQRVGENGYAWWYIDAMSDDGHHGLTIIAFIGSVFSPYYAAARRRGAGDPEHHVGLNVALYGRGGKRWAMTERGRAALQRDEHNLVIGPSHVKWDRDALVITIDETTVPIPSRLCGTVRLMPTALAQDTHELSAAGHHRWRPIAPFSRVDVAMRSPDLKWSGQAYFDWNSGDEPLEDGFRGWHWSRASSSEGTTIFYDGHRRRDGAFGLALEIDKTGKTRILERVPPVATLPTAKVWRMPRLTRSDASALPPRIVETCEDTPFYARSIAELEIDGRRIRAMHESLSLDRFRTRWVQGLLPFRMPRRAQYQF